VYTKENITDDLVFKLIAAKILNDTKLEAKVRIVPYIKTPQPLNKEPAATKHQLGLFINCGFLMIKSPTKTTEKIRKFTPNTCL